MMHAMLVPLAAFRDDAAGFIGALVWVYTLLIIAYILTQLVFGFGGRVPYSRWSDAILTFLRDVCEPYLRFFRRFIPPIGPLDISPIVAIFALQLVGGLLVSILRG
jgi:uncharacterized protein YggT (Ycf19 family)